LQVPNRNASVTAGGLRPSAGLTFTVGTVVKGIATLVAVLGLWFFLAPPQLGGSSSYVITYGTSMEPAYHAGDLVIVRKASSYRVGEIVAYRNGQLGGHVVMHRIIAFKNGRYTFKGDNNNFVDSYHPTQSELVGRKWVHLPAAGKVLGAVHGPRLFLIAGALALLLIGGTTFTRVDRRKPRAAAPTNASISSPSFGALPVAALAALVLFGGLAALAYKRPTTAIATQSGLYTQNGTFSYDASAPEGAAVYGADTVKTGQPIFLRLVKKANFHFAYSFESKASHSVAGTAGLDAILSAPDGWKRTLQLSPKHAFRGDKVTVSGSLDFQQVQSLLDKVGTLSNVTAGTYTLTLQPHVSVRGAVNGSSVDQTFGPKVGFLLDQYQLQLQPASTSGTGSASALTQSTAGSGPVEVPNTVTILKFKPAVTTARHIGLVGAFAALLLLAFGLYQARGRRPQTLRESIDRRFGDAIVPVTNTPHGLELPMVSVASIDALMQIADQLGRVVLHLSNDEADVYFVEDSGFVYMYEPETTAAFDAVPRSAEASHLQ
jgi:signal peptidase I